MTAKPWYVYLIECRNGALYTGITPDVAARYTAHLEGRGARYTRANPPVRLVASKAFPTRSAAASQEWAIKRMVREEKWQLADAWMDEGDGHGA